MRFLAVILLLTYSAMPAATVPEDTRRPVVVELFTSEGCSSCPPADALLRKLDRTQPVPGAFVIALSEHVDYWDRLGWKDPFSSPVFSRRQEAYGRRFQLDGVYTPQAIIDGNAEAVGSDARQVQTAIQRAVKADRVEVKISPVFRNSRGVPAVHLQVDHYEKPGAQITVALAENTVISHVRAGENNGRTLDHVAVVRSLMDLGPLDSTGAFQRDIPLTGELEKWKGKRLVVLIQDQAYGRIQGAAVRLLSAATPD